MGKVETSKKQIFEISQRKQRQTKRVRLFMLFSSFTLVALQVKIQQIQKKLKKIEKNLKLGLNYLKNKSVNLIISKTKMEYIDRTFNDMITNDLQKKENETLQVIENGIKSSQQFNIDYNTIVR